MLQVDPLTFEAYQVKSSETAVYPGVDSEPEEMVQIPARTLAVVYTVLGLVGEAGEIANKVKKILRDGDMVMTDENADDLAKEAGDVAWYLANFSSEIGKGLEDIAAANLAKLADRKARGVLQGSGDNR